MGDLAMLPFVPPVQNLLHALPNGRRHQWLMASLVGDTAVAEISRVDLFSEDLVQRRDGNFALALPKTEACLVRLFGECFERIFAAREPLSSPVQ